jgi:hypothetical protein
VSGSDSGEEARVLGFVRRPLRTPALTVEMSGVVLRGAAIAALALLASLALAACSACDGKPVAGDAPAGQASQAAGSTQEAAPPAAENPTPVGQAVDAIAAPAIAEVLGAPVLTNASPAQALIVNLVYTAPDAAADGDGELLRDEFLDRGAAIDPDNGDVEDHGDAEEFVVRYDTGDPAYQTIRVTVTPGSADVYVNADKSE